MYKLGHWDESKPRPLLVSLRSFDQKEKIMSNLRNLKQPAEKFQGMLTRVTIMWKTTNL